MPPSAITGTSPAPSIASNTAVSCGTPTPVTTRVVQIEPGPTPTLTASTPRSTSDRAPSRVATFPAISCTSGKDSRTCAVASNTASAWPCAVSTTSASTPASISAFARVRKSPPAPIAAATRSRPISSLFAPGNCRRLWMSLTVISPFRRCSPSTTGSFSTRCLARIRSASSSVVPCGAVMRFLVIASATGRSRLRSNCRSRLVRIPTRRPSGSTIGMPETRNRFIRFVASRSVAVSGSV